MHKQIFTAFIVLSFAFSCNTYYAHKFLKEHPPPLEPVPLEAAAFEESDIFDSLSYVFMRKLCPGEIKGYLDKMVKLSLVKELLLGGENLLLTLSLEFPEIYTDALSPRAMSYQDTKRAMANLIANGYASGADCEVVEKAAKIYYRYGLRNYESDICSGRSTLAEVYKILKKSNRRKIKAVSYSEFRLTSSRISSRKMGAKAGVDFPLCHQCIQTMLEEADRERTNFSEVLKAALRNVAENCPIKTYVNGREAVLFAIRNDTYYFLPDGEEKPVSVIKIGRGLEIDPSTDFSGEVTINGEDMVLNDSERKGFNPIYLMTLFPFAAFLFWRWKIEKT